MIVVCPECRTSYLVPVETFTTEAKTLKCSHCLHQWLEEGDISLNSDELFDSSFQDALKEIETSLKEEESQEGMDDISSPVIPEEIEEANDGEQPENTLDKETTDKETAADDYQPSENVSSENNSFEDVMKIQDSLDSLASDNVSSKSNKTKARGGNMVGAFAAVVVFITLFVGSLALKDTIVKTFPNTAPLYSAMGFNIPIEAEGLAFDRVKTEWNGSLLSIKGNIINLLPTGSILPKIRLSFQSDSGETLDEVIFSVSGEYIKGEDVISFKYEVQAMRNVKDNTSNVKISFIGKS